jgi:hypothetical protein
MKKHGLALLGLGLLFLGASAFAQTINLKADIPFNFIVAGTKLPSGTYSIESLGNGVALAVRAADSGQTRILLSSRCASLKRTDQSKLVFHRYGDRYFLAQVWMVGNDSGRELPKTRQEIEVAASYPAANVVLLAALK